MESKIIYGDCIEEMKKLPDESIDLVLTDPPYNTGMQSKNAKARLSHFFDDKYSNEDYEKLVEDSCKEFYRLMKQNKGGYIY